MTSTTLLQALCFNRADLPANYQQMMLQEGVTGMQRPAFVDALWDCPVSLQDRATCETDANYQQLLPYIVLECKLTRKVFVYYRGKGGAENRLKGKLSIGLGGHIETLPAEGQHLMEFCKQDALRELQEEVGLTGEIILEPLFALIDPTGGVGSYHLGLLFRAQVDQDQLTGSEADVIVNGFWADRAELLRPEYFDKLENWSKLAFLNLP